MTEANLSPNGEHKFTFEYAGEIPHGPMYFEVRLDGEVISDKYFGPHYAWHPARMVKY
jgi:hypothetical protein